MLSATVHAFSQSSLQTGLHKVTHDLVVMASSCPGLSHQQLEKSMTPSLHRHTSSG